MRRRPAPSGVMEALNCLLGIACTSPDREAILAAGREAGDVLLSTQSRRANAYSEAYDQAAERVRALPPSPSLDQCAQALAPVTEPSALADGADNPEWH